MEEERTNPISIAIDGEVVLCPLCLDPRLMRVRQLYGNGSFGVEANPRPLATVIECINGHTCRIA